MEKAEEKIKWFQAELQRLGTLKQFKNKHSVKLFTEFMGLNISVLRLLRFQAINKTAVRKILKSTSADSCPLLMRILFSSGVMFACTNPVTFRIR